MEMESLHTLDNIQTADSGSSSKSASYRDAQVWKDIEAETGFASYADYLGYYSDVRQDFGYKWEEYQKLPEDEDAMPADKRHRTIVYDLLIQGNYLTKLSLRRICDSGTELIQALRKPPDGISVQLVLWFTSDLSLNQEMVDALVLGLKLDLDDFKSRKPWSPAPKKFACQVKSIFSEQTVATISQDFMPDVANAVPVVLVAGRHDYWGTFYLRDKGGNPPVLKSPGQSMRFEVMSKTNGTLEIAGRAYARAVEHFVMQDTVLYSTKPFLLLAAMSPLLYAEACRITEVFDSVQRLYTRVFFWSRDSHAGFSWGGKEALAAERLELRRVLEMIEDLLGQFSSYSDDKIYPDLSRQLSNVAIVAQLRSLIADARRLDAEVRDSKQVQVGDLALEESRKAIDLSNAQIREAKSGKSG